ncbi:response regulator [Spirosoma daeguense]
MPATSNQSKANYQQANMLFVEEEDDQWRLIQEAISKCLLEVETRRVTSVDQAVSLLQSWQHQEWELPKLIVVDLHLPTLTDGWQLLRAVKSMSDSVRRIPIVVFSSSTLQTDIGEAYQLGAASYLIKPTELTGWLTFIDNLRTYWWETVTLPPVHYGS